MSSRSSGRLWVATSYFNPAGYRRRRENYHAFRRRLNAPLLTVEWSADGRFELGPDDAEIVIHRQGGDVMWQKERMLNVGIPMLPAECDKVAWIDCDVVFERPDWVDLAYEALDRYALVHLFTERHNLAPDRTELASKDALGNGVAMSVVACWLEGRATAADFSDAEAPLKRGTTAGLAWAARRDVLERYHLYDACVLGSGDRVIVSAALGQPQWAMRALKMEKCWAEHYQAWADPFFGAIQGRLGCLPVALAHMWHGTMADRRYASRHETLRKHVFDPARDLAFTDTGCWRWNTDKPSLHTWVRQYFRVRREDG